MPDGWDIPLDLGAAAARWAQDTAPDVESAIKETAPVSQGGAAGGEHFVDSIEAAPAADGVDVESSVIGRFLVEGTAAHDIPLSPKPRGTALRFEYQGETMFRRQVHHPGTGPSDFLERAIDAGEADWADKLGDAIAADWSNR